MMCDGVVWCGRAVFCDYTVSTCIDAVPAETLAWIPCLGKKQEAVHGCALRWLQEPLLGPQLFSNG